MPKFGERYCFEILNDKSVCPYIGGHESYLWTDLKRRFRDKCIGCDHFRQDLRDLRANEPLTGDLALALLDEVVVQGDRLSQFRRSAEMHAGMFDTLAQLSGSLKLALHRNEIFYKALVSFTGGGFGFNRGIALVADDDHLSGFFALGPRDREEAARVWGELSAQAKTLVDLLHYSEVEFRAERDKFNTILEALRFPIREEPFERMFQSSATVLEIGAADPVPAGLRAFYGTVTFWIVPLCSHLGVPLGALLLDHFLIPRPITDDDRRAMAIFAAEISLALERAQVLQELQEKVQRLQEANQRIAEAQDIIFRLRENAAASQMVLQLTHSIKNPVVAIGGLARRLQRRLADNEGLNRYTEAIAQEALRLEGTVRDFVKFADAKYATHREPVQVNGVIEALYQEKRAVGRIHHVKFHLELVPDLPLVSGDSRQLYNCLENIVVNALEAMPKGGELTVMTSASNGTVRIEVADTGPGIPEEALTNIFKPFFSTKPAGSGLGLFTSREVIEAMGGRLSVKVSPGHGCRVLIEVPSIGGVHDGKDSDRR